MPTSRGDDSLQGPAGDEQARQETGEQAATAGESGSSEGASKPSERTRGPQSASHHPLAIAIASAIATVLVTTVGVAAVPPVGNALDNVRDFFRGYDDQKIDDLREVIPERPYWTGGDPKLLGGSIDFLALDDESLVSLDRDGYPVWAYPSMLSDKPFGYEGTPIVLVGRVTKATQFDDEIGGFANDEVNLAGPDGVSRAYAGLAYSTLEAPSVGDLVALQGVVTAVGRVGDDQTAYFTATRVVTASESGDDVYTRLFAEFTKAESASKDK